MKPFEHAILQKLDKVNAGVSVNDNEFKSTVPFEHQLVEKLDTVIDKINNGGGDSDIFVAKHDKTTNQELYDAYAAGKILVLPFNDSNNLYYAFPIVEHIASTEDIKRDDGSTHIDFICSLGDGRYYKTFFGAYYNSDSEDIDAYWTAIEFQAYPVVLKDSYGDGETIPEKAALSYLSAHLLLNADDTLIPYTRISFQQAIETGAVDELKSLISAEYGQVGNFSILCAFGNDTLKISDSSTSTVTNGTVFIVVRGSAYIRYFVAI